MRFVSMRADLSVCRSSERSPLLRLGWSWLPGREDRLDWSHVWEVVLDGAGRHAIPVPTEALVERGRLWLELHAEAPDASVVWSRRLIEDRIESLDHAGAHTVRSAPMAASDRR